MTRDLRPYPAYKDSGVPWLGEVPAHWAMRPLKRWVRINAEVLPEDTDADREFRYLDIGTVGTGMLTGMPQRLKFGEAPSRARRVLHRNDTIISTVRTYLKAVYFVSEDAHDLIASTGFAVLTPGQGVNSRFLSFLVQSDPFTDRVSADSVGIAYPAIAETRLGTFHVAIPPLPEQAAIVRYLDYVDRRIRRYIRAKQKLIALLNEQKQAIIQQAVTRGLDPHVRLKPSGVEWLGDVPEHWGISPSKRLFSPRLDRARPDDVQLSATQAYGVIPQEDFEQKVGRRVVKIFLHLDQRRHVEKDDFVISMRSFQGGLERAWTSGCIRSSYVVLRPTSYVDVGYFAYLLKSYGYVQALQTTSNFIRDGQDLNFSNFSLVDLPVVPLEEQEAIAGFLDQATVSISMAIDRARREVDLLREYRTRLIADVVTGKLDVRVAAAGLPEEGEESELTHAEEASDDIEETEDGDLDDLSEETDS
jgi:type I restriction enzyme S subunit